ncbi:helix-turn-helix domain-containing protein [Pseudoflavonifractor phocaeensis]|uniref:helix-turn-helix domain-containing protein n=1 Tax=Pseudoflavonifractor phocaeensis TaxID=1870988 RepID=UPI001F342B3F|nr:helix-turn-helix transcriptional regulator [Pseudoflavonifractor phocaeensis]MCF2661591.1 helix-turn-helix transcriptional regulator [Pseudoflavonifractor phocaeensis]
MTFSRIRDLREDRDLNQETLAEMLGVRQTTYSKYELGKINVPVEMLIKIADFYDVTLDYLVGRSDEMQR